jgi:DNA helicase-2/ATP-dependent DNA helicase PcrA
VTVATDHLAELNEEQRDAATTTEGPILILAGAGSGKTRVITHRIAHLIESCDVRPEHVLAVTFTNKAAGEMRERVERLLAGYYSEGARTGSPLVATFHSLCVRILRRDIDKLRMSFTRSFTIYDQDDQERLMKQVLRDLGADEKQARIVRSVVSAAKNRGDVVSGEVYEKAYALYEQRLKASNALDFDDLLIYTVKLLKDVKEVRDGYHNRFRHVMVDEFQDTNQPQYSLVRLIVEGEEPEAHVGRQEPLRCE